MKKRLSLVTILLLTIILSADDIRAQKKSDSRDNTDKTKVSKSGITGLNVEYDSTGEPTQRITMHIDGDVYKIKIINDRIKEIYLNDKEISEENFFQYEALVIKVREQIRKDQEQAEFDRQEAQRHREQAEMDRRQAELKRQQIELERQQADKIRLQTERDPDRSEKIKAPGKRR